MLRSRPVHKRTQSESLLECAPWLHPHPQLHRRELEQSTQHKHLGQVQGQTQETLHSCSVLSHREGGSWRDGGRVTAGGLMGGVEGSKDKVFTTSE